MLPLFEHRWLSNSMALVNSGSMYRTVYVTYVCISVWLCMLEQTKDEFLLLATVLLTPFLYGHRFHFLNIFVRSFVRSFFFFQ